MKPVQTRGPTALGVLAVATLFSACGGGSGDPALPVPDPPPDPPGPCTIAARCGARIALASGAFLPHYATYPLDQGAAGAPTPVVRAVLVVHGNLRNADAYFERVVTAAEQAGRLAETLIVAPRFQTSDDAPRPDEPYWTSPGWKRGHPSAGGAAPPISSYQALDTLVARLANRTLFPDLAKVVVTGHSAGGQVAHRYAAGSPAEDRHDRLAFRHVVANPSTYLYPTPVREWAGEHVVPDALACPEYDEWHYGLQALNPYMTLQTADSALARLLRRDAVVLVGDQDTGSASLDQSCGANYQGPNRYQRGLALVRTLDHVFPGSHRHRAVVVPGVGHSSTGMYQSSQGRDALFGW